MLHSDTKTPVTVEEEDEMLCVRLHTWGDADFVEDLLVEDLSIDPVWYRIEKNDAGEEVAFVLTLPEAKNRDEIQRFLDQTK